MVPPHWLAAESVRTAHATILDAVKTLDVRTPLREVENAVLSPGVHILLDR